jgi:hypothetical protein
VVVGGVLSIVTVIGGVNAYQAEPEGTQADQIYTYGDN